MVRLARFALIGGALALVLCWGPGALLAEDQSQPANPSNAPAGDELKILHQMLDQQSRQLDVLAQEIARLNLLLEGRTPTASGLAPSPAAEASLSNQPAPASPAGTAPAPKAPKAPKAVAVDEAASPGGPVHIVTKGETLTAIAKAYKVRVADLLKVNKITDVRKLQIGQSLALPPGAKLQESASPPAPSSTPTPQQ
jgi:LysM repeat protein